MAPTATQPISSPRPMAAPHADPSGSSTPAVIIGAGGHGRVVLDILLAAGYNNILGFLDSDIQLHGRRMDGMPVLGSLDLLDELIAQKDVGSAIVAIGNNGTRRHYAETLEARGLELLNAIHPSANIARNARLGRNVVVAAGATVCCHCQIGNSAILNTGCIIDHESMIGTATHICPGARIAGRVTVESGAFLGIGCTVIQGLRIGYEAVVGAGAVVIHDVEPMTTVVGIPAQPKAQVLGYGRVAEGDISADVPIRSLSHSAH